MNRVHFPGQVLKGFLYKLSWTMYFPDGFRNLDGSTRGFYYMHGTRMAAQDFGWQQLKWVNGVGCFLSLSGRSYSYPAFL